MIRLFRSKIFLFSLSALTLAIALLVFKPTNNQTPEPNPTQSPVLSEKSDSDQADAEYQTCTKACPTEECIDGCILKVASQKNDPMICILMRTKDEAAECSSTVAKNNNREESCNKILDEKLKQECLKRLNS